MQLFVIALVISIFLHDGSQIVAPQLPAWQWLVIVLGPKLVLILAYWLHCGVVRRRLTRSANLVGLRWLQASGIAYRWLLIASFGQDLYFGALVAIRRGWENLLGIPDPILVDEMIIMIPPLATLIAMWWVYYPIDRRIREASIIRDLDEGKPIYRIWTRGEYLLSQIRHNLAFMLVPLLLIMAWIETINLLGNSSGANFIIEWQSWLTLGGIGCVFLATPLLIRRVWDTAPMPAGELRDKLIAMCKTHRIGIRQLLVWRTYGAMINAAVIGVIAPLRYILMTDALLETLPARDVEAVMAHEIAHIRRHHMFWMLGAAAALLLGLNWLWFSLVITLAPAADTATSLPVAWLADQTVQDTVAGVGTIVCWLIGFGWVSRRFERQADTFAVQHLSAQLADDAPTDPADNDAPALASDPGDEDAADADAAPPVHADAVATMSGALGKVATLNHMPAQRRGWWARLFDWLPDSSVWRHGSIAWRQAYLHTLVGQPVNNLAIDRQVRWIKLASALAIIALIALSYWE